MPPHHNPHIPIKFFRDYRWSQGTPIGIDEIPTPVPPAPTGHYFKFIPLTPGLRVEQYANTGQFLQICHDPADQITGTQKHRWHSPAGEEGAIHLDAAGKVVFYEKYTFLSHDNPPLVRAEIYTADGRLLATHEPQRITQYDEDIYVRDALGKLKVILHHRGINHDPCEIHEEWSQ